MPHISLTLCSNTGSCEKSRVLPENFNVAVFRKPEAALIQTVDEFNLSDIQSFINENKDGFIAGFIGYSGGEKIFNINGDKYNPLKNFPAASLWKFEEAEFSSSPYRMQVVGDYSLTQPITLKPITSKEDYLKTFEAIQSHIQQGDVYEINYCIGFEAEHINLTPEDVWHRLLTISPMPFAAFLETDEYVVISASPERFLYKDNDTLYCQPMKGTLGKTSLNKTEAVEQLRNNPKEQSENVMIVDLTRNDLSKIATRNSVKVDELFGVYEFQTIYQMISTVSAKIRDGLSFTDIIEATFPMGSMTGAPKKSAMQLIHRYESFNRGVFSGMLGYLKPDGVADFNVLIRTIFYDKLQKKIFIAVGSAITAGAVAEKEYEECLIKLQPLLKAIHAEIG